MKKISIVLIVVLICSMLLYTGCSQKNDTIEETTEDSPITTSIVHGNASGVWFMLSTAIAEGLDNSYKGSIMHPVPGYTVANLFRINENELDFAMTHTTVAYSAINGTEQYEEKLENIGGVAIFYPSVAQFVLKKDLNITSFSQFIEEQIPIRVSVGAEGGLASTAFKSVLSQFGVTVDDLEGWGCKIYYTGFTGSSELFADDEIDGMWTTASAPTPVMVSMGTNTEMVYVSLGEDLVNKMVENYGYARYTIPAEAYDFMDSQEEAFTTFTMLSASLEVSDDVVYKVTRSIYENLDYIKTVHAALNGLSTESLIAEMTIPLHPGAEKFYKEIGLID